jgi:hypothetical protein
VATERAPPDDHGALRVVRRSASPPSTTAINVTAGTGQYFRIHDLIRNELTGEIMRVNSIATDALTCLRNIGNTGVAGAASVGTADPIVRLGNASAQGATMPTIKMTKTVFEWNWTQIQRDGVGVVNSARDVKMYGGSFLDVERKKKMIEHYVALENSLWFGKRDLQTASAVVRRLGRAADGVRRHPRPVPHRQHHLAASAR